MRLSLKCTAARHATKFHSGQSVSLPIRTLRKRRGTTAPKIQKLLKSIHPRDHGRRGARDGRTDLLPVFPVVNSHRASKQFILIARAPSSVPARVRVVASSTETRARARISNHSRTNSNFQTAHLLGSPSTLGASSRRSTDLPARSRERHKKSRSQSHGSVLRFPSSRRPVVRRVSFAGAQRAKKKRTQTQSFPSHPSHPSSHSSSSSRRRSSPVVSRVVSLASGIFSRAAARVSSSVSRVAPASRPRVTTDDDARAGRRARASSRLLVWKTCFLLFVWFNSTRTFRLERLFLPFHGS